MAKSKRTDWQKVGTIAVDAGIMWLGDPCYVLPRGGGDAGLDYDELIDDPIFKKVDSEGAAAYKNWMGVVCSTGYGDGSYDVFIKKAGNRVAEMRVVFIEEGEEDLF